MCLSVIRALFNGLLLHKRSRSASLNLPRSSMLVQEGATTDSLCDGEFCSLISKFEVPKEGSLRSQLFEYLSDHGAQDPGILINAKSKILEDKSCPFCQFAATIIRKSFYADAPDASECFVVIKSGIEFWLEILEPDKERPGILISLSERIVLVTASDQASAEDGRFYDHAGVNFADLSEWLRLCSDLHNDICPATDEARLARADVPDTLRVVDVLNDCLVDIPWTEHYVALSYVWGDIEPPKLFKNDLPSVYDTGSLKARRQSMPRTIQDSMTLTIGLKLRYLWFDALCLVQDSKDDLDRGIQNMDIVYEHAYVTVIAANGPGANSGLPGVGQTPRNVKQQPHVLKERLEITSVLSLDDHLNRSAWASRGWTLQEHYLSRRTINFVNGQAYFRCRQRIWCEELWTDRDPRLQNSGEWVTNLVALARESMDLEESIAAPQNYLFTAIARYQQRHLKFESDTINAMTGILQRVSQKAQTRMVGGLPVDILPLSLNFLYRFDERPKRKKSFPSWSWAGWTGIPDWYAFMQVRFEEHPEELGQALSLTCAFIGSHDEQVQNDADRILWHPESSSLEQKEPYLFKLPQTMNNIKRLRPETSVVLRPYELLSIKAVTLYVRLESLVRDQDGSKHHRQKVWQISGKDGRFCGYLFPDATKQELPNDLMELFLLSKSSGAGSPFSGFSGQINSGDSVFWAMLVIPMADGVYERRGIGQVLGSCISYSHQPGPRWQEFVLG